MHMLKKVTCASCWDLYIRILRCTDPCIFKKKRKHVFVFVVNTMRMIYIQLNLCTWWRCVCSAAWPWRLSAWEGPTHPLWAGGCGGVTAGLDAV